MDDEVLKDLAAAVRELAEAIRGDREEVVEETGPEDDPMAAMSLSTRIRGFLRWDRAKLGLSLQTPIREFVKVCSRDELKYERNIGPKTINELAAEIRRHTGLTW